MPIRSRVSGRILQETLTSGYFELDGMPRFDFVRNNSGDLLAWESRKQIRYNPGLA